MAQCIPWNWRRWISLLSGIIETVAFFGFYYGINALIPTYKSMKLFANYCDGDNCDGQDKMFGYALMAWIIFQMLTIPLSGFIMDRFGLRLVKIVSTLLLFTGTLMFAFVSKNTSGLLFICGCFTSLGGVSSMVCNLQISSMFTTYRGLVISIISGAFDSSSLTTYFLSITFPYISFQTSFIILASCQLIFGMYVAFCLLTKYAADMLSNSEEQKHHGEDTKTTQDIDLETDNRLDGAIRERFTSLKDCIISIPFLLISCWFTSSLLRFTFFLSQLGQQLKFLFPDSQQTIDSIQVISSVLLMCGIVLSPISGMINDTGRRIGYNGLKNRIANTSEMLSGDQVYYLHLRGLIPGIFVSALAGLLVSILIFIPSKAAIFTAILLCVVLRSLLFSCLILFLMSAFPIYHFGTLNGLVSTIAGVFSLIQYGLLDLHPTTSNIVMCFFSILMFITPTVLFFMSRR